MQEGDKILETSDAEEDKELSHFIFIHIRARKGSSTWREGWMLSLLSAVALRLMLERCFFFFLDVFNSKKRL